MKAIAVVPGTEAAGGRAIWALDGFQAEYVFGKKKWRRHVADVITRLKATWKPTMSSLAVATRRRCAHCRRAGTAPPAFRERGRVRAAAPRAASRASGRPALSGDARSHPDDRSTQSTPVSNAGRAQGDRHRARGSRARSDCRAPSRGRPVRGEAEASRRERGAGALPGSDPPGEAS
jgi:hypothetical protein